MQCGRFPRGVKLQWRQHDDAPSGAKVKNECAQCLASIHGRTACRTHYMRLFQHRIHIFTRNTAVSKDIHRGVWLRLRGQFSWAITLRRRTQCATVATG